ncbi:MAG TPA: SbmA/BacA-like family transporter [Candidatus Limnocylindrales bacterium]|nr:SbmA/BacA-like family transporter [Candidatus Limnocylindrales bacterium]
MNERPHRTILNETSRARFMASVRDLIASKDGLKAKLLLVALLVLLVSLNSLNVLTSYIGRDFMTAVADRNWSQFVIHTLQYVLVLAACTVVAVIFRYVEERLGLLWRKFLTRRLVDLYLRRRFYHQLGLSRRIANPDQRITDDVKFFTTTTLSFALMLINATMSVVAFSGVLLTISPTLFWVAVGYATVGSAMTILLGRPMVWINYNQFDREAELRAELVQLRENSEFVALTHQEAHFARRLGERIDRIVHNARRLISVNRNLNFFTSGYNYYIPLIPVFVVAPLYLDHKIEFGEITQASIAFAQLLGGFSLIVTQFQSISSFTAVVARLDDFSEAAHESDTAPPPPIEIAEGSDAIVFEHLTLESPEDRRILIDDLNLNVPRGTHVLVTGPGEMAKMALFRATADLWECGRGRITRPRTHCMCFIPERPYLPPGTLRETLFADGCSTTPTEKRLDEVLRTLDLEASIARIGGLDVDRDWDDVLSLGELQRLAIARLVLIAPEFAMLDRIETTLEPDCMRKVLEMLDADGTTYVTIGRSDHDLAHYELVLELSGDGPWSVHPAKAATVAV